MRNLLRQLAERGLSEAQLVIADEHRGLAQAVRRLAPEVWRQRCTVHLERNVLTEGPQRLRGRVAGHLCTIFQARDLAGAKKETSHSCYRPRSPDSQGSQLSRDRLAAATLSYAFPKEHRVLLKKMTIP
jgi:putative transposase